eukprot:gene4350-20570_t
MSVSKFLEKCSIGSHLQEEFHSRFYTRSVGIKTSNSLTKEQAELISSRTGLEIGPEFTICHHHEQTVLAQYSAFQKKCCDPFQKHKNPVKGSLREVSIVSSKSYHKINIYVVPGQKLCPTYRREMSERLKTSEGNDDDNDPDHLRASYGKRKLDEVKTKLTEKQSKILNVVAETIDVMPYQLMDSEEAESDYCDTERKAKDFDEIISLMKDKIRILPPFYEKIYRAFVLVMCVIGICWVPIITEFQGGQLFIYIQAISAYLAPPVASVYLIAIFWKRSNEQGAFWGLMSGFIVGVTRMVLDFVYQAPECGVKDTRPIFVKDFHYMYFALMIFLLTGIVCIVVSLLTPAPDPEMIVRTTFFTRHDPTIRSDEIQEEAEMKQIDAEEQKHRAEHGHTHQDNESALWVKENDTVNLKESVEFKSPKPFWKKVVQFFCGMSDDIEEEKKTAQEQTEHLREITSLHQDKRAKMLLYGNLLIILTTAVFLYIFFSIPDGGPTAPTIPYGKNASLTL